LEKIQKRFVRDESPQRKSNNYPAGAIDNPIKRRIFEVADRESYSGNEKGNGVSEERS